MKIALFVVLLLGAGAFVYREIQRTMGDNSGKGKTKKKQKIGNH